MRTRSAPPHRLPHLRFRHPIGLHRPRHDDADAAVARRVRRHGVGAHPANSSRSASIKATWLLPGFTIESWPKESAAVVEAGHEIGHHSWAHIPNGQPDPRRGGGRPGPRQRGDPQAHGRTARGYRSPSWDLSAHTIDLLIKHSFLYNSSLMGADYIPYRARRGDEAEVGKPYGFGEETVADRNADLLVARRLSAFRVHPHAADGGCRACSRRAM